MEALRPVDVALAKRLRYLLKKLIQLPKISWSKLDSVIKFSVIDKAISEKNNVESGSQREESKKMVTCKIPDPDRSTHHPIFNAQAPLDQQNEITNKKVVVA